MDGRSDIYSLGIVLFEMLTGVVPFDSPTTTAIVVKHVNDSPPPPRTLNPKISRAVESVALRALEKRRDSRPQTAGEMARELIAAAGSARAGSPHPTKVVALGAVTPAPIATPIWEEVVVYESNGGLALLFGKVSTYKGSSRRLVLAVFGALLLLAGGGLWMYLH